MKYKDSFLDEDRVNRLLLRKNLVFILNTYVFFVL